MRVVVVGAGIGGTSAALDLRSRGIDVEVFERTPEPRPLGGGLFMWSNGMNALGHLGLADEVASLGEEIVHFEFSTERGRRIGKMYFGESAKELGAPTVCLIRAELSEALVGAVPDEIINFGMECTGFEQDEAGVTVRFANGHEERCDVLVGADGRDSLIRRTLLGAPEDRFFGLTSWRAVIPFEHPEAPPQTVRSYFGCGEQFIFHPVGKGRQFWAAIAAAPPGGHDVEGELKPALLERFEKYPTPVREIIEATEESTIIRMDVVDRAPAPRWGEGRVTLLGDAIHLMAPMAGQGACQGLEDAIVLGNCLGRDGDVESALRSYEATRQPRTASVGNLAHRNASNVAVKSRPGCVMRNLMMRAMWAGPAPKAFVKMLSQVPAVERAA
jgi:2-polyprenyl-6-methoxyphenol hydroxylase-like FAD-dependent oxidoreductase